MLYFSRKNMAGVMWTPPGTMTTMSWPNSSSMTRRWGSSEMLNTAWSNSDWTYGRRVPSAFSQDDLVSLSVCALSNVPGHISSFHLKLSSHRAKAENFFDDCHSFFDLFCLFFDLFCFRSRFRMVWIGHKVCSYCCKSKSEIDMPSDGFTKNPI